MAASRIATGRVGDRVTSFPAPHHDGNPTTVTTQITMTLPMSHEDIEAV